MYSVILFLNNRKAEISMCAKYFVPVAKMGCEVGVGFLMVHIMLARPAVNAKGYQTRCGPGKIIATMILYGNIDVHYHENPCGEKMASEDHRIQSGPEAYCHQLPAPKTLSG